MSKQHPSLQLISQFRGAFISVGIFSIFFNLLVLTLPLYMLSVFTRVLTSKSQETLMLLTIAALSALFIQALLDMIRSRIMGRIGMALDASLTPHVLEAVVRNAAGSGDRDTQPLRDVGEVRGFLSGSSVFTLFDAPFAPFYVAVIFLLHPLLGSVALIGALVLFAIAVFNELSSRKPVEAIVESHYKTQARVDEFVRNADAIEAMGMMPTAVKRWRGQSRSGMAAMSHAMDRGSAATSLAKFVRFSLQIGLFGAGAYLYTENAIQAGSIIAASILMGRALAPVESAIGTWKSVVNAKAAYKRLEALLTSDRFLKQSDRTTLPRPSGRIELERVVVMPLRSERLILKGVSLKLNAGQFLGVIGPSGAGKTTLAKVLVGLITPRGGAGARIDGAELSAWHPDDLGKYIGYLPQDIQLFPGTVRENIARMAPDSDSDDVVKAAKLAGVHEMILGLPQGYDSDIGDGGRFLSAGQRQHIGLARAFYGDPVLLVLDEPNSNLDAVSESALSEALAAAKERGITIVVVTHRPSVLKASDQLLLLKDGVVEMYGPSAEVMARMRQGALPHDPQQQLPAEESSEQTARHESSRAGGAARQGPARARTAPDSPKQKPRSQEKRRVRRPHRNNGQDPERTAAGGPAPGNGKEPFQTTVVRPKKQILEPAPRKGRGKGKPPTKKQKERPAPVTIDSSIVRADAISTKVEQK